MSSEEHNDNSRYHVVVNHEEQYSIWPEEREIPLGWKAVGSAGTKEECLARIEEVWTDMRPLSLRKAMAAVEERNQAAREPDAAEKNESSDLK